MTELDTPCRCPRCGWLGTLHESHACHPTPETALDVCPRCAVPTEVQRLGQKGLDALRAEHALLLKGSYQKDASADERAERRAQIERLFEVIGQPLKNT